MSDLDFGAYVIVSHQLRRCYVNATKEHSRPVGAAAGAWTRYEVYDGPLRFVPHWGDKADGPDGLPGLPMPDPSSLPEKPGDYRMLRRFPLGERGLDGRFGVLVGRTFRMEGQRHKGIAYSSFDGEWEPPSFDQSRRVPVLQVALKPRRNGNHPWPSEVIDALPADVTRSPF